MARNNRTPKASSGIKTISPQEEINRLAAGRRYQPYPSKWVGGLGVHCIGNATGGTKPFTKSVMTEIRETANRKKKAAKAAQKAA